MKVGVPIVPGTPGPVDKWSDADSFIKEYGFPGDHYLSGAHTEH
jgi:pyruvate carboxylase